MSSPNSLGNSPSSLSNGQRLAAADASRKRNTPSAPVYSPNETLNQMTQEAEARQQDKYNVQKEIRAIRAQEMEKQRKEDESRDSSTSNNNNESSSSRHITSTPTISKINRKHSSNSRSIDDNSHSPTPVSNTPDPDNPRELKKKLNELEEKYTKHAVYQTQFENDNQKLLYEVDILKDLIEEHEELISELRRQFKEKSRELDYQKRTNKDVQADFVRLKEILKQRDHLIEQSGLQLYTDNELNENGQPISSESSSSEIRSVLPAALVQPETAKLLDMLGEGTIDDKLRKLLDNKSELKEINNRLKSELEDERIRISSLEKKLASHVSKIQDSQENAQDLHELQRQYTKEINEFKMRNQKLDHENIVIKQDLQRLQTQLKYLQTNFDEIEQSEQRLNKEKREAQRELKDSKNLTAELQDRVERLEASQKAMEKQRKQQKINEITSATVSLSSLTHSSSGMSTPTLVSSNANSNLLSSSNQQFLFNTSLSTSLVNDPTINPTINDFSDRLSQRKKSVASVQILPNLEKPLTISNVTAAQSIHHHTSSPLTNSSTTVNTESSGSPTPSRSSNSSSNSSPSTTSPPNNSKTSNNNEKRNNNQTITNLSDKLNTTKINNNEMEALNN